MQSMTTTLAIEFFQAALVEKENSKWERSEKIALGKASM
jgi:hypothetical protein